MMRTEQPRRVALRNGSTSMSTTTLGSGTPSSSSIATLKLDTFSSPVYRTKCEIESNFQRFSQKAPATFLL
jgi:hypothetical protein